MENKKILIVDDDNFLLDMYAIKFKESGYDVQTALGSMPALEILKKGFVPDAILMDIIMPVMDGFQFLEKMREEKLCSNSSCIILSNRGQEEDMKKGEEFDVDGYIVKADTTPSEVISRVEEIMKKGKK